MAGTRSFAYLYSPNIVKKIIGANKIIRFFLIYAIFLKINNEQYYGPAKGKYFNLRPPSINPLRKINGAVMNKMKKKIR